MRIKRAVSFVLSVFTLLFVTVALCACWQRNPDFYYVAEDYEKGNITLKEVREIAKVFAKRLGGGVTEKVKLDYPDPYTGALYKWQAIDYENTKLPELSAKKDAEIKDAIYIRWENDFKYAAENDKNEGASKEERLEKYLDFEYCGKYRGKYAIAIRIESWMFNCAIERYLIYDEISHDGIDRVFFLYY